MPSPEERASICLIVALIEALEANGTLDVGEGENIIQNGAILAGMGFGDEAAADLLREKIAPVLRGVSRAGQGLSLQA